jgi:hypothetical protein
MSLLASRQVKQNVKDAQSAGGSGVAAGFTVGTAVG